MSEQMIQANSIASEKVCDHPSTEKAERLLIGLDTVARQIRSWLEWNTKQRERNDPPLTTTDDTTVMLLPVPFWPSHGTFNNWIELFEESAAAIRAGQMIANPANLHGRSPESSDPSLLGRETVRESAEQRLDADMTLFNNARAEAIEECAKIAEAFAKRFSGRLPEASDAGIDIAEDIRSLSPLKD